MKKVLFATTNPAKVKKFKDALFENDIELITLKDIDVSFHIEENGKNAIENALIKAKSYYDATGYITIGMDNSLYFEDVLPNDQPGTYVRRVNGRELTDEEMIVHYTNLASKYDGKINAKWEYGLVIYSELGAKTISWNKDNFYIVETKSENINPGYPLDSISIIPEFNKFLVDLTPEERESKKRNDASKDEKVIEFIVNNV